MKKNNLIIISVAITVVAGVSFYSGMKYSGTKTAVNRGPGALGDFANLTPEDRAARAAQFGGANMPAGQRGSQPGANLVTGDIISQDDKTVTIKLRDGGSRIIILSDATQISKSTTGARADLIVGGGITVSGEANQDGSLTAQSIQLRPASPVAP